MPNLSDLANYSTVIQGIAVLASLVIIIFQLRQQNQIIKASNVQAFTDTSISFNSLLINDKSLLKLWYSYGKELTDETDILRYRELLTQWLIIHENIFYQYRKKLIAEETYKSWKYDLHLTTGKHNMQLLSDVPDKMFPGEYGKELAEMAKKK